MTSAPCLFLLLQSLWWNETFLLLLKYGPFPASVHFQELTVNMIITKIGRLLDSNCRPLILEASALSTEPLHYCLGPRGTNVQAPDRGRCPEARQRRNICSLARRTGTNTAKLLSCFWGCHTVWWPGAVPIKSLILRSVGFKQSDWLQTKFQPIRV